MAYATSETLTMLLHLIKLCDMIYSFVKVCDRDLEVYFNTKIPDQADYNRDMIDITI
jgi:hypothetical protein